MDGETESIKESGTNMTEVVAALIWDDDKFMICQRPKEKARGLLWEDVYKRQGNASSP